MKTPMMRESLVLVLVPITLMLLLSTMEGQAQERQTSVACGGKLSDCNSRRSRAMDMTDMKRACCAAADYSMCVDNVIAKHCPGTVASQLMSGISAVAGGACSGYTFWTPECLWYNYTYEVIGAAAGLAVILLILLICCCCCCCRSKKS